MLLLPNRNGEVEAGATTEALGAGVTTGVIFEKIPVPVVGDVVACCSENELVGMKRPDCGVVKGGEQVLRFLEFWSLVEGSGRVFGTV